jgi:hypothetical protein
MANYCNRKFKLSDESSILQAQWINNTFVKRTWLYFFLFLVGLILVIVAVIRRFIKTHLRRLPAPQYAPPFPSATDEELKMLHEIALAVLRQNKASMEQTSRYISRSYRTVFVMYVSLFVVGILTAAAAIYKGLIAQNGTAAIPSLIFAGLSAASFFTLFLVRPLESLERNTFFSSWIVSVVNTYWTRLMYLNNLDNIDTDLKDATTDLITALSNLTDKYAAATGKHSVLTEPEAKSTSTSSS